MTSLPSLRAVQISAEVEDKIIIAEINCTCACEGVCRNGSVTNQYAD